MLGKDSESDFPQEFLSLSSPLLARKDKKCFHSLSVFFRGITNSKYLGEKMKHMDAFMTSPIQ